MLNASLVWTACQLVRFVSGNSDYWESQGIISVCCLKESVWLQPHEFDPDLGGIHWPRSPPEAVPKSSAVETIGVSVDVMSVC